MDNRIIRQRRTRRNRQIIVNRIFWLLALVALLTAAYFAANFVKSLTEGYQDIDSDVDHHGINICYDRSYMHDTDYHSDYYDPDLQYDKGGNVIHDPVISDDPDHIESYSLDDPYHPGINHRARLFNPRHIPTDPGIMIDPYMNPGIGSWHRYNPDPPIGDGGCVTEEPEGKVNAPATLVLLLTGLFMMRLLNDRRLSRLV